MCSLSVSRTTTNEQAERKALRGRENKSDTFVPPPSVVCAHTWERKLAEEEYDEDVLGFDYKSTTL